MTLRPYFVVGASIGMLAVGFALGNLDSTPTVSLVENLSSNSHQVDNAVVSHSFATDEQKMAVLQSEFAEIKRAAAKAEDLQGELKKLSQEVASLRTLVEKRRGKTVADRVASTTPYPFDDNASMRDPEALDAQQQNKEINRKLAIDNAFWAEPVDALWSNEVTQTVTEVFEDLDTSQTELSQMQCHSSLCLIEVEHADATAADEFSLRFPVEVGEMLPQASYHSENLEDGGVRITMYFARDGYDLPTGEL